MFLCNSVGILALFLILLFHMMGIKEKKASSLYITEENNKAMW